MTNAGVVQVVNRIVLPYPTLQLGGQVTGQKIVPINSNQYVPARRVLLAWIHVLARIGGDGVARGENGNRLEGRLLTWCCSGRQSYNTSWELSSGSSSSRSLKPPHHLRSAPQTMHRCISCSNTLNQELTCNEGFELSPDKTECVPKQTGTDS